MRLLSTLGAIALSGALAHQLFGPVSAPKSARAYDEMSYTDEGQIVTTRFTERIEKAGAIDCKADPNNEQCRDRGLSLRPSCMDSSQLCFVYVDRAKLSEAQNNQLEELSQSFPPTSVGKRCSYYTNPAIWCLLLKPAEATNVYAQLQKFGEAAGNKDVRRLGGGDRS